MAELFNKATGAHLATLPDRELADIVFANVITAVNMNFYETLEGEIQLSAEALDKAMSTLDTDPLLDSLKRPTLEMLRAAMGDQTTLDVTFKEEKTW
jgi:hypothetical protein